MLIVQERATDFTSRDPNIDVMRPLADAFDKTGKFAVSIYSQGDSLVHAAIESGEWKKWTDNPRRDDIASLGRVIGADFIVICKAVRATGEESDPKKGNQGDKPGVPRQGGLVRAKLELFSKRFSPIYNDDSSVSVLTGSDLDIENTALAISNSWSVKLFAGPLKEFTGGTATPLPSDIGNPTVPVAVSQPVDKKPFESGMLALKEERLAAAITYLRDAVDADPLNPEPRLALIDALRKAGKPFLAADEAARGAVLLPEDPQLLSAGAAAWLDGGQLDKAFEQVSAALAKNPDNPLANMLMGDLRIRKLDYSQAIGYYDKSLKMVKNPEVYFKRSIANALKGDFDASKSDLKAAIDTGLSEVPSDKEFRYGQTLSVVDSVFSSLLATAKNLKNEAAASPKDTSIGNRLAELQSRVSSFLSYLDLLSPPTKHAASHAGRGLALNLLVQSVQSIQKFLFDKNEDTEQDANLLLIEAGREYSEAVEKYKQELAKKS